MARCEFMARTPGECLSTLSTLLDAADFLFVKPAAPWPSICPPVHWRIL